MSGEIIYSAIQRNSAQRSETMSTFPTSYRETFEKYENQGWDDTSKLNLLMNFIESKEYLSPLFFDEFLAEQVQLENIDEEPVPISFEDALEAFINGVEAKFTEDGKHLVKIPGKKLLRLATQRFDDEKYRSAYAFIALEDGMNKKLGYYEKGDIFKPDGWKAPAKHARGNIFNEDHGLSCAGPHGIAYLK